MARVILRIGEFWKNTTPMSRGDHQRRGAAAEGWGRRLALAAELENKSPRLPSAYKRAAGAPKKNRCSDVHERMMDQDAGVGRKEQADYSEKRGATFAISINLLW
jgi:hypothetical protein